MQTELLKDREVAQCLGCSLRTVWRWSRDGVLPAPRRIGPRTTRWSAKDIRAFIENAGQEVHP